MIHFIDVGYGDAVMIQAPEGSNCMIDGGNHHRLGIFLQEKQIKSIDWGLITHGHKNHFEGFRDLIADQHIKHLYVNAKDKGEEGYASLMRIAESWIPVDKLQYAQILNCGEALVRIIHPLEECDDLSLNDSSTVSLLTFKNISVLFSADVGTAIQERILKYEPSLSKADVIQIPHHGDRLLKSIYEDNKKGIYVVSTGPNPWDLPNEGFLNEIKGRLYRTDYQGTITIATDGDQIDVVTER